MIFCYAFFEKCFIEGIVTYHKNHQDDFIILNLLTILNILSIIPEKKGVFIMFKLIKNIFGYFKETDKDDLDEAIKELGGDYDEDDIRLVRIKFISDMGN